MSGAEPRTALVTGASRGIGRAIALALAGDGYDVAVTARTVREGTGQFGLPGSLERTVAEIEALGRRALAVPLDLLDRDALVPAVDRVLDEFGHLDVLVNNAIYVSEGGLAPVHRHRSRRPRAEDLRRPHRAAAPQSAGAARDGRTRSGHGDQRDRGRRARATHAQAW